MLAPGSNSTVLKAIIDIMGRAVRLAQDRKAYELADRLKGATTHCCDIHASATLLQATGDLVMVHSLAEHACLDTTSRYLWIPRHLDIKPTIIWTLVPRLLGHLIHVHLDRQSERSDAGLHC